MIKIVEIVTLLLLVTVVCWIGLAPAFIQIPNNLLLTLIVVILPIALVGLLIWSRRG